MDRALLVLVVSVIDRFLKTLALRIDLSREFQIPSLIFDILRVLIMIPSDKHVCLEVQRVQILLIRPLEADVIFVQELACDRWVNIATK